MASPATLLGVLDSLYAAALDETRWPDALRALNRTLGGAGTTLELHDIDGSLAFFEHVDLPPAGVKDYGDYYHTVCPRLPFLQSLRAGDVGYDAMHMSEADMDRSEFYADFLRPDGLRHYIAGLVVNDGAQYGIVTIQRPRRRGQASNAEIGAMSRLLPHLRNAVRVSRRIRSAVRREEELRASLERLRFGAVLVDDRARVVYANRAARALLLGSGPLHVRDGVLTTHGGAEAIRLRIALGGAIGRDGAPRRSGACAVGVMHPQGRISVITLPLPQSRTLRPFFDGEPENAAALVLLSADHRPREDATEVIAALYRLTPAESRLALALIAGSSVDAYARRSGIKVSTARTHMVNLRAKLDARSQTEAVTKLLATVPPVDC